MPSLLDKIDARRTVGENQQIAATGANAAWAETFHPAQAEAANIDLDALMAQATARKAQLAQDRTAQSDPHAYAQIMEANARTQHARDMAPLNVRHRQAQIEADNARETATTRASLLKQRAFEQEAKDTDAFHAGVEDGLASGIRIGTPAYAELLAGLRIKAPAMKSGYFDDLWKGTANSQMSSEDAVKLAADKAAAVRRATNAADAEGRDEAAAILPPEGMMVDHVVKDSSGRSHAVFKPATATPEFADEAAARGYFGTDATLHRTAKGQWTGTVKGAASANIPAPVISNYETVQNELAKAHATLPPKPGKEREEHVVKIKGLESSKKDMEKRHPGLLPAEPKAADKPAVAKPDTEVIERDGRKYEVNHKTKAVTPL